MEDSLSFFDTFVLQRRIEKWIETIGIVEW